MGSSAAAAQHLPYARMLARLALGEGVEELEETGRVLREVTRPPVDEDLTEEMPTGRARRGR